MDVAITLHEMCTEHRYLEGLVSIRGSDFGYSEVSRGTPYSLQE
jgi:hypothetical protein